MVLLNLRGSTVNVMQMPRMWIIFICLSGTTVTGQSLNSWSDMDTWMSSESPALETTSLHPSSIGSSLLDTRDSSENVPNGKIQEFCL